MLRNGMISGGVFGVATGLHGIAVAYGVIGATLMNAESCDNVRQVICDRLVR